MSHLPLDANRMRQALAGVDTLMSSPATLVVGEGAAMVLAYDHPKAEQAADFFDDLRDDEGV